VQRPVQILGSLDGIETGIRQLIREAPLETMRVEHLGESITVPTAAEILRIKGVLILKRNATRDYLDFIAVAHHMGESNMCAALQSFDVLYAQENGQSPLQQLQVQLATPLPYDLDDMLPSLAEYKNLDPRWHQWNAVKAACTAAAMEIFDHTSHRAQTSRTI
jgi:hypothetical protein